MCGGGRATTTRRWPSGVAERIAQQLVALEVDQRRDEATVEAGAAGAIAAVDAREVTLGLADGRLVGREDARPVALLLGVVLHHEAARDGTQAPRQRAPPRQPLGGAERRRGALCRCCAWLLDSRGRVDRWQGWAVHAPRVTEEALEHRPAVVRPARLPRVALHSTGNEGGVVAAEERNFSRAAHIGVEIRACSITQAARGVAA